jgi:parallel beta-helix repeat protein
MIPAPTRLAGLLSLCALALLAPHSARLAADVLADTTFNSSPWTMTAYGYGGATAGHSISSSGTIDSAGGSATAAAVLTANASAATGTWGAGFNTGWISVNSPETNLALLNLSFDLWTSHQASVRVWVHSYNAAGTLTGTRSTVITPPVAQAFYRHSLDIGSMTNTAGSFAGDSRWIQIYFEIGNGSVHGPSAWPSQSGLSLRVDNIAYTSPSYFVDEAAGRDWDPAYDGRSIARPFKTIQRALSFVTPGDVVFVRNGTYLNQGTNSSLIDTGFTGSPSRWLVVRAFPGHQPLLTTTLATPAWNIVRLTHTAAYIEIRGLHMQGLNTIGNLQLSGAEADYALRSSTYHGSPTYNGNAGSAYGNTNPASTGARPHHIRFIDNVVWDFPGGGLGAQEADYVTIAGNTVRDTSLYNSNATSGISLFHSWNFSSDAGHRNFILGNTVHDNRTLVRWYPSGNYSDGNGIIVDDLRNTQASSKIQGTVYTGRTLIANNIVHNNGGGGIQIFKSDRVDVINNTSFKNSQRLADYGEILVNQCSDVRMQNNILWALSDRPINASKGTNSNITITHNVFARDGWDSTWGISWGGTNNNNSFVNPIFENAANADFRLKSNSTVKDNGLLTAPGARGLDVLGNRRPIGSGVSRGAHEH